MDAYVDNASLTISDPTITKTSPPISVRPAIEVLWPTELGVFYQLQFTSAIDGLWVNIGDTVVGDGSIKIFSLPVSTPAQFFRVEVLP